MKTKWCSSTNCNICGKDCMNDGELYDCITTSFRGMELCRKCKEASPYSFALITKYKKEGDILVKEVKGNG